MSTLQDLYLPRGAKGLICGRNGTGKSFLGYHLIPPPPTKLCILDSKGSVAGDKDFSRLSDHKNLPVYTSVRALKIQRPKRFLFQPAIEEVENMALYNDLLLWLYREGNYFIYFDDTGGIFTANRYPKILPGVFQRGRAYGRGNSKHLTILVCVQKPANNPRPMVTEAWNYYLFDLNHPDDIKLVRELTMIRPRGEQRMAVTYEPSELGDLDEHRFFFVNKTKNTVSLMALR